MSELTDLKLNYLKKTKQAIREALIAKGQEVSSTDTFRSYASKITAMVVKTGKSGLKITTGEFTAETGGNTIEHNMGVVPDVIVVFCGEPTDAHSTSNSRITGAIGYTQAVMDKTGVSSLSYLSNGAALSWNETITNDSNQQLSLGLPRGATATQFKVGGGTYGYSPGKIHRWIAFGNLLDA